MRIGQCLGCKLLGLLVTDYCSRCQAKTRKFNGIRQLPCDVCGDFVPTRMVIADDNSIVDLCRACYEDTFAEAGD